MTLAWWVAAAGWALAGLCFASAFRWYLKVERSRLRLDYAPPPKPIPRGLSKNRFLLACAENRGVTTQWMKDLGYTVEACDADGSWRLVEPVFSARAQAAAEAILGEMFAVAKTDPAGARVAFPDDSWMLIAKVIRDAEDLRFHARPGEQPRKQAQ